MCIYKDKADGHCRFRSCAAVTEYCVEGPCVDEVLTNADRIRSMSDEELAEFLCAFKDCSGKCMIGSSVKDCSNLCATKDSLAIWLQQPAEEDDYA